MISEILRHIFIERLSLNETALIMGISGQQLRDRVRTMEQMGYIKKAGADMSLQRCSSCSSCKICLTGNWDNGEYMLTDKGSKLIGNK